MEATIFIIAFTTIGLLLGYSLGISNKGGRMLKYTNSLPNSVMTVISIDKTSAIVEDIITQNRYLVSTEVFGGKPIRPKDTVRKIKSNKEREELGIPVLGYPPLVKADIAFE